MSLPDIQQQDGQRQGSQVIHGDCLDVMRGMAANSIDATVTDPPYALTGASRNGSPRQNDPSTPFGRTRLGGKSGGGFMGKIWDAELPSIDIWRETLRVMKPGAYLVAFGGTRTSHRLVCAIEDAGFEIHDSLCWLFGSGFPKHKSKLKPAHEPICLARKPAARATMLNIDDCRIAGEPSGLKPYIRSTTPPGYELGMAKAGRAVTFTDHPSGRWPANVCIDEEAARALDEQTGTLTSNSGNLGKYAGRQVNTYGTYAERSDKGITDSGGASRFYYCAKASRAERNAGCDDFDKKPLNWSAGTQSPGTFQAAGTEKAARNPHPTVKPVALMRWLVRLVTPPNGLVLDPFTGSGTTGIACVQESRRFIGIEREADYVDISRARIAYHAPAQTVLGVL